MPINERPGVYSSIEVISSLIGSGAGKVVGVAAVSEAGATGVCKRITSYAEAVNEFGGGCNLTEMIRVLFLNGAYAVEAIPAAVDAAAVTTDYEAAFAVLMSRENIKVMICDSDSAEVHAALKASIASASESCKYRIGIVEAGGTVSDAAERAEALNCERIVMAYPQEEGSGARAGVVAAALAGVIAAGGDPALPLNGAQLYGLEISKLFGDAEISALVQAGVTPIECVGGSISAVRGVTTRTHSSGEPDSTWRELTTVLIIDDIIPSIRSALRLKFPRVKNTVQTRGAIRTQVIIELESKLKQEIIDDYDSVIVEADAEEPTICIVSFEFTVAHGLNRINLTAHISV